MAFNSSTRQPSAPRADDANMRPSCERTLMQHLQGASHHCQHLEHLLQLAENLDPNLSILEKNDPSQAEPENFRAANPKKALGQTQNLKQY